MTLCAALRLLRSHNASLRYLSRQRAWRVIAIRPDGTMLVRVCMSVVEAVAEIERMG